MSISKEGYSSWLLDGTLGQTYSYPSQPRQSTSTFTRSPLSLLLIRLASKITELTHSPWALLQRSYFYKDNRNGIQSTSDLGKALEHFHILLSESELQLLFESFPSTSQPGRFDFKLFARTLFPPDDEHPNIEDGRKAPSKYTQPIEEKDGANQPEETTPPYGTIPLENPVEASFTASAYVGGGGAARSTGRRRMDVPAAGSSSTSSRIFGSDAVAARGPPVRIEDLHSIRSRSFVKAASNALAHTQGKGNKQYYATRRSAETAKQMKGPRENKDIPRVDFLNLSRYEGRYERSQAATESRTYLHTAR